jgi:microsomal dipeptidase-like Zn-dependent dipeptidase
MQPQNAPSKMMRLLQAFESPEPIDRGVAALRHFKQLGFAKVALVHGIRHDGGAKQSFRALKRLTRLIGDVVR